MQDLSVVIIAQNEERTIGRVLESGKDLGKEIILVDSGSTDHTIEIAERLGAKCRHQDWLGFAGQKNFAVSLSRNDWVLSLDADEMLTPELKDEIQSTLSRDDLSEFDGFRIPRILFVGEQPIKHGGFYPDAQLRLFNKNKGNFPDRKVHETFTVSGRVGLLKNPMLHYAYPNLESYAQAMDKYARLSAEEFAGRKNSAWKTSMLNELIHPWWTFFYRFILRGGFLDGAIGLKANLIYMDYVRNKIVYLREKLGKNRPD